VGSTTTMSLAGRRGAALVSEISSSETLGAATMRETLLDALPSGLRILDGEISGIGYVGGSYRRGALRDGVARGGARDARNCRTEPGPGADAAKLLPSTRQVNPWRLRHRRWRDASARIFAPKAM